MSPRRQLAAFDDLLAAIESITGQIKVLVSAVDDLRCEVEWRAKEAVSSAWESAAPETTVTDETMPEGCEPLARSSDSDDLSDSLLTAAGRLQAYEKLLFRARRGLWLDEFASADDFLIPEGLVFSVDADLWASVLAIRPAHVVGEGCGDCQEDDLGEPLGAPYLLAWRTEREYLLRELTDEEARRLQALCLVRYAEEAAKARDATQEACARAQRGLF